MTNRKQDIALQKIGILTSGGDCPGLNAIIYTVVKYAQTVKQWQVYGIPKRSSSLQPSIGCWLRLLGLRP